MHTGSEIPILKQDASMQQVLIEMTSKRLGCVGFINDKGELKGILTDGDLRRCLSAQALDKPAFEIMTKNPKTVEKDLMASAAMKIMNDKKITNLFVLEDKKPIGVIHIHDLLTAGII